MENEDLHTATTPVKEKSTSVQIQPANDPPKNPALDQQAPKVAQPSTNPSANTTTSSQLVLDSDSEAEDGSGDDAEPILQAFWSPRKQAIEWRPVQLVQSATRKKGVSAALAREQLDRENIIPEEEAVVGDEILREINPLSPSNPAGVKSSQPPTDATNPRKPVAQERPPTPLRTEEIKYARHYLQERREREARQQQRAQQQGGAQQQQDRNRQEEQETLLSQQRARQELQEKQENAPGGAVGARPEGAQRQGFESRSTFGLPGENGTQSARQNREKPTETTYPLLAQTPLQPRTAKVRPEDRILSGNPAQEGENQRNQDGDGNEEREPARFVHQLVNSRYQSTFVNCSLAQLRTVTPADLTRVVDTFSGASSDWAAWSVKFKTFCNFYGLKQFLLPAEHQGPHEWDAVLVNERQINQVLFDLLLLVLDETSSQLVRSKASGHGMLAWHVLNLRFRGPLELRVAALLERLARNRWRWDREHLSTYFARIRLAIEELTCLNHPVPPQMHSSFITGGLPVDNEMRGFQALNRVQHDSSPEATEERLRRFLLHSEKYRPVAGDHHIMQLDEADSDEEIELIRDQMRVSKAKGECYACGKPGHMARNCPTRNTPGARIQLLCAAPDPAASAADGSASIQIIETEEADLEEEVQLMRAALIEARKKGMCFQCGKPGHKARDCQERPIKGKISKYDPRYEDWMMKRANYTWISGQWGEHDLDPFASEDSHQTPRFFTAKDNALLLAWIGERLWVNPPWWLIALVLAKLEREVRVPFTFIAPWLDDDEHTERLVKWSRTPPLVIPHEHDTFKRIGRARPLGPPHWPVTLAWNCHIGAPDLSREEQFKIQSAVAAAHATHERETHMREHDCTAEKPCTPCGLARERIGQRARTGTPLVLAGGNGQESESISLTIAEEPTVDEDIWKMDSGSSTHATCQGEWLTNRVSTHVPVKTAADGKAALCGRFRGKVPLTAETTMGSMGIELGGVLHIPGLRGNILSASRLTADGIVVDLANMQLVTPRGNIPMFWHKEVPCVKMRFCPNKRSPEWPWDFLPLSGTRRIFDNRQIRATAHLQQLDEEGDAETDAEETPPPKSKQRLLSEDQLMRIHRACAHVSLKKLRAALGGRVPADLTKLPCHDCQMGKAKKLPVNDTGDHTVTRPFQMVVTDLMGPREPDLKGRRYVIGFVDKYSGFKLHFVTRSKKNYHDYVQKALFIFGHIETLRGGQEIKTNELEALCRAKGISIQRAVPYQHTDLGPVERSWLTIADLDRSMRNWAGAPKEFWSWSWLHAVDVTNRLPNMADPARRSPYDIVSNIDHPLIDDASTMPIWGCLAYVHIPAEKQQSKLDARAWTGMYLGNARNRKGYKVFLHGKRIVVTSRDVTFVDKPGWTKELFKQASIGVPLNDGLDGLVDDSSDEDHAASDDDQAAPDSPDPDVMPPLDSSSDEEDDDLEFAPDPPPRRASKAPAPVKPATAPVSASGPDPHAPPAQTGHDASAVEVSASNILPDTEHPPGQPRRSARLKRTARVDYDEGDDLRTAGILALDATIDWAEAENYTDLYDGVDEKFLTYARVMSQRDRHLWEAAMRKELQELHKLATWTTAALPPGRKCVRHKWVFRRKMLPEGTVERYKARLVGKGFTQVAGVDYHEVFSPVVRADSARIALTFALSTNRIVKQVDIGNAYLNAPLEEDIFLSIPEGMTLLGEEGSIPAGHVLKLLKGLPGLRQSGRNWHELFTAWLIQHGFEPTASDSCIFIKRQNGTIVILYVDDMLIAVWTEADYASFAADMKQQFRVTELGDMRWFLGVELTRSPSGQQAYLNQSAYVSKVLERFGMAECNPCNTPVDPKVDTMAISEAASLQTVSPREYRAAVGALLHLTKWTRPDVALAVNIASRFNAKPTEAAWLLVTRILRFLRRTPCHGLVITVGTESLEIQMYCDSDFGGDTKSRKSTTGYVVFMSGTPVCWCSKRQSIVATSTLEAEYIALFEASQEIVFVQRLINELSDHKLTLPTPIYCDNEGAKQIALHPKFHKRTKHIDIKYHKVRERVKLGVIRIESVASSENTADIFTKGLARVAFQYHSAKLVVSTRAEFKGEYRSVRNYALSPRRSPRHTSLHRPMKISPRTMLCRAHERARSRRPTSARVRRSPGTPRRAPSRRASRP
ncbi:MAG TPA: DNA N-6-adenine-methyltransferase, partial [Nitrospiraceae bacterium]|nr:DNA N-6-adenine-methyltransferase [Nitrospiraceae bacterium]